MTRNVPCLTCGDRVYEDTDAWEGGEDAIVVTDPEKEEVASGFICGDCLPPTEERVTA